MGAPFPVNDRFVRFDTEAAYLSIADTQILSGGNRVHVTLDFSIEALPGSGSIHLAGKAAAADFEFTLASTGIVSFVSRRSGGNKTAIASTSQALVPGKRYILEGVDDGTTVTLYVNGVAGGTAPASATGQIVADTAALTVAGGTGSAKFYLFAFQIVRDELLALRLYVREEAGKGVTAIADTSGYGNVAAIVGTEGTTVLFGTDHLYEPVWAGAVTL